MTYKFCCSCAKGWKAYAWSVVANDIKLEMQQYLLHLVAEQGTTYKQKAKQTNKKQTKKKTSNM
jgi:hypothetical protein